MSWTRHPRWKKFALAAFGRFQFVRRWHGGLFELWFVAGLECDVPVWFAVEQLWEVTGKKPTGRCMGTPLSVETW